MGFWAYAGVALASGGISAGTLVAFGRSLIEKRIDHHWTTKLEDHKHQLDVLTEGARFDYARKIHDFGLFSSKRHEVYSHLYEAVRKVHGGVVGLFGYNEYPNLLGHSTDELRETLKCEGFLEADREDILSLWTTDSRDRDQAQRRVHTLLRQRAKNQADRLWAEAWNEWLLSEIYLSDSVLEKCGEILRRLNSIRMDARFEHFYANRTKYEERARDTEQVNNDLGALRKAMREELMRGDYEPRSIKSSESTNGY